MLPDNPLEADIVAVRGNPLADITILQNIGFVMKDGVVVKRDGDPIIQRARAQD